jgi:hypothetical protein
MFTEKELKILHDCMEFWFDNVGAGKEFMELFYKLEKMVGGKEDE